MRNPQAYKKYQQARKENRNPNEFLNEVVGSFSPDQKQQWDNMMSQINGIKTQWCLWYKILRKENTNEWKFRNSTYCGFGY